MSTTHSASTQGPARQRLKSEQIRELQGSLVVDNRRRRPLFFDGRFLAARDLVREQNYFLTRQADLGRAGGFGVVEGLYVQRGAAPTSLTFTAGHGVTPAGELVVLPRDFTVELTEIPEIQRLNAAFGLLEIPHDPPRNRTGLFVVALRPVEFSANPVASYPTSLTGPRSVEDGEIVEGAVVTLIPYADEGPDVSTSLRRARVAHEIFVGGTAKGEAAGALPLAIVALNRGTVEWVDPFLVRREAGSQQADVIGLGFSPRGLREAHLLQYEAHLREVISLRRTLGYRFAATEYFQALPPAGRLPAACIDPGDFSQIFFPSSVDVDLSIVPEDEIPALVEESLSLAPIDLTRSSEELDSTAVLIVIPLPRNELRTMSSSVSSFSRSLKAAAPGMLARRTPLEVLRGVRLPGNFVPLPAPAQAEEEAWRRLLARGGMLWYVRRKTLHQRADLAGERELLKALQAPASDASELNRRLEAVAAREAQLKAADQALAARETEVTKREKEVARAESARDKDIGRRETDVAKREGELNRREEAVKQLEGGITKRDAELRRLEAAAAEREAAIKKREAELQTREAAVQKRENEAGGREATVANRTRDLDTRENVLRTRETGLNQRETALQQREGAIKGREDAVNVREHTVTTRERARIEAEEPISRLPQRKVDDIRRRFEP